MGAKRLPGVLLEQFHLGQLFQGDQSRAHAIVDVVRVVGDLVGEIAQLRFQTRLTPFEEAQPDAARLGVLQLLRIRPRAVFQDAFARFECEVQAVEVGIALFQPVDHAKALQVEFEPAVRVHALVQRILARVAERGVSQVVCQRDGLDQVFVQAQRPGDRSAQLCHFQRVGHTGAKQVSLVIQEYLSLVNQPPERRRMHDPVAVALELGAGRRRLFGAAASARERRIARVWRQARFS